MNETVSTRLPPELVKLMVREVEEETGLKVRPQKLVGVYSNPTRSPVKHVVTVCYYCKILEGTLKPSKENVEVKFFELNQLPEEMAFDHKKVVEDFLAQKLGDDV